MSLPRQIIHPICASTMAILAGETRSSTRPYGGKATHREHRLSIASVTRTGSTVGWSVPYTLYAWGCNDRSPSHAPRRVIRYHLRLYGVKAESDRCRGIMRMTGGKKNRNHRREKQRCTSSLLTDHWRRAEAHQKCSPSRQGNPVTRTLAAVVSIRTTPGRARPTLNPRTETLRTVT